MSTDIKLNGDRCRCEECGELFNSTYAFDKHRRGAYTDRRCLTGAAMSGEGFTKNSRGYWMTPRKNAMVHRKGEHAKSLSQEDEIKLVEWYESYEQVGTIRAKAREIGISAHTLYDSIRRVRGGDTRNTRMKLGLVAQTLEEEKDKTG